MENLMRPLVAIWQSLRTSLRVPSLWGGQPMRAADGSPRGRYLWQAARLAAPLQFFQLRSGTDADSQEPAEFFIPVGLLAFVDELTSEAGYAAPLVLRLSPGWAGLQLGWPGVGVVWLNVQWKRERKGDGQGVSAGQDKGAPAIPAAQGGRT
jgi:hypothetical protein